MSTSFIHKRDAYDLHTIIVWKKNEELINIIKEKFKSKIIFHDDLFINQNNRINILKQIYEPVGIDSDDPRCLSTDKITLFLIKLDPIYENVYRSEGYRLCNLDILNFKLQVRKKFNYLFFHCSDNVYEANKVLKLFNLNKFIPKGKIIHVNDLHHFIWQNNDTCKIVKIKDSPAAKYLIGYNQNEEKIKPVYTPKISTLNYFNNLNPKFSQKNCEIISVFKKFNKYIISDGMHRSSVLYFYGNRELFVYDHSDSPPMFSKHITEKSFSNSEKNSHLENFNEIIYRLNNNNIRFVIIRGYKNLPYSADTDLDIIIHPKDYNKFTNILNTCVNDKLLYYFMGDQYKHSNKKLFYKSYRTNGTLENNLTNKCYQLDFYNTVFFFKPNKVGVSLSDYFISYLFDNKLKFNNVYIPNEISELVLILCRNVIDKQNKWKDKHKTRYLELIKKIDKSKYIEFFNKSIQGDLLYLKNYDIFNI